MMMLMNDISSAEEMNCSNTLKQMQSFDLSRPKDIMTFIEVEPDNCNETTPTSNKNSNDDAQRPCPLSRKRKSMKENNYKMKKKTDFSTDKDEEISRIENVYHVLKNGNKINSESLPDTRHNSVFNFTQRPFPVTLINRFEVNRDQRVQANISNFHPRQMNNIKRSVVKVTNQSSSTIPPWQTPASSMNLASFNLSKHGTNYGLNIIIEEVLNFLTYDFKSYTEINKRRLALFQRCYTYVVHYCLFDLNRNDKVFNRIILNIVSMAQNRSRQINHKQTWLLLDAMFEWCRQKKKIETNMDRYCQPAYHQPAYDKTQLNLCNDQYTYILNPHIQRNLSPNNSNSLQINNGIALNKDQTCLFRLGAPGKEVTINVDTSVYRKLQNKPETTIAKFHTRCKGVNIENKDTSILYDMPHMEMNSGQTTSLETGQNTEIREGKDSTSEIQNQSEISSSSVSRDSEFISSPHINSLEEKLISLVQRIKPNEHVTPIITHVTLLNN